MNSSALRLFGALACVVFSTSPAPGQELPPCALPKADAPTIPRSSRGPGYTVDACGRIVNDAGILLPFVPGKGSSRGPGESLATAPQVTIAQMATYSYRSHPANGALTIVGPGQHFFLSDGSDWTGGSGSDVAYQMRLDHVEVSGTTVRYFLLPPISTRIFQGTDFDSGQHSAQGTLGAVGPLVLEATDGGTIGTLHGLAKIINNDATSYGEPRFNYYTAPVSSVVQFVTTMTLYAGDTFTADLFTKTFDYQTAAVVDFANPVSVPHAIGLTVSGPSRIASGLSLQYRANVAYEGGSVRDLSASSTWGVDPSDTASIANGLLTTGVLASGEEQLTLQASFTNGVDTVTGQMQVRFLAQDAAEAVGSWPMFQANARHTGFVAIDVDPRRIAWKWQRILPGGLTVNPVAAGEGKVFATLNGYYATGDSLFALDASNGSTLWSKNFGGVASVTSPSFAYGNVYLQVGADSSSGPPTIWSLDGATGAVQFQSPTYAQYQQNLSATVFDRKLYTEGGYYGYGAIAYDGDTGSMLWNSNTAGSASWTPAVDADRVWAYSAGLSGVLRSTGGIDLFVPDPGYAQNSYYIDATPVLGGADDLLVVQGGRLICFDLLLGSIRWQLTPAFTGSPSVAENKIYVADAGGLNVIDELTHASLWSWTSPDGPIQGPMIVTPGYVFVSTPSLVHAISLATHAEVWSYPASGQLAIADETLYVASSSGLLTAFALPPGPPPPHALDFYTVTPCRVFDSREASGPAAGAPSLGGGESRLVTFAGKCGIPPGANAVSANVTAILPGAAGELDLSLAGISSQPAVSYFAGQLRANNVLTSLSVSGDLYLTAAQQTFTFVDVAIDVNGYFQ